MGILASALACAIPRYLVRAFTGDDELIDIAIPATRFIMVMFPLIAFTIVNSNFFQSIDKPWIAIVTSLSRQLLFLLPMCYIVPLIFESAGGVGLHGIWASCTISDVMGASLAAIFLYAQRKVFKEVQKV